MLGEKKKGKGADVGLDWKKLVSVRGNFGRRWKGDLRKGGTLFLFAHEREEG